MRIALIAPPFISVPPNGYGGTELFIAHLAEGLVNLGHEAVVYTNGESTVNAEIRALYPRPEWPSPSDLHAACKEMNHSAWAARDAVGHCDLLHVNSPAALSHSRWTTKPFVYTLHHIHEDPLSDFYTHYPETQFVAISDFQRQRERMPRLRTIHHGIDPEIYNFSDRKQDYLVFLGRIAPMKGTHLAIEVAQKSGMPLKIAGDVQPVYREYFERFVKPHLDGTFIEYVGEVDLSAKNELLGSARAMLFPIQWHEPFGLVMLEAMACGTPVLALAGGSVEEVVRDGVSGHICAGANEMVEAVRSLNISPAAARRHLEENFSLERMCSGYASLFEEVLNSSTELSREVA